MTRRTSKRERRLEEQNNKQPFISSLRDIKPLTNNQSKAFEHFWDGKNLVLHGISGTGKTFLSLYLTLSDLLSGNSNYNKIFIVRSTVPSRDAGFLPGNIKEKIKVYEEPYQIACNKLFGRGDAYGILKSKNLIEFVSTSYLRGVQFDDAYVIVDEMQNCTGPELDTIITRLGDNSKIILSGDYRQTDFQKMQDRSGLSKFLKIIKDMNSFHYVEFDEQDIVRSGLVKKYIMTKHKLNIEFI